MWNQYAEHQVHKWIKQRLKNSPAPIFLEEAAGLGRPISLSNGHLSRCLFLTESIERFIKRLSHFKIIPKSSSNWQFFCLLVFCFLKLQIKVRSLTSSSENSFVTVPECRTHCARNTISAAPVCPCGRKESTFNTFTICSLWNSHMLRSCLKKNHQNRKRYE